MSQNPAMNGRKREHAEKLREELHVFKRRTPKQFNAKIGKTEKDIAFLEAQLD